MKRITFRAPEWIEEGLDHLTDASDLSRSELVRRACTDLLREWSDELPEWVRKEATHEDMVKRNRPELRQMHFKQRTFEYAKNALTNDRGGIARYPPHPDKLERHYGRMLREEVNEEHGDYRDEFAEHVDEVLEWYRMLHPNTSQGTVRGQAVAKCAWHFRHDREGAARNVAAEACSAEAGPELTEHMILDDARSKADKETWIHKTDQSIRTEPADD